MSSAALQCLALGTMLIDHIGFRLFPQTEPLRMVGRLAFPIFAFLLAEGFVKTGDRKRYFLRLGAFALLSEIPYKIFVYGDRWGTYMGVNPWRNVFFELVLMFLALWCAERGGLFWLGAGGLAVLAEALGTMYGGYGVLLAMGFFLFREKRWAGMLCLGALTLLYCGFHNSWFQIWAVGAAVPLGFYNGQRGRRLPRYFGYVFYPAHLLAIYAVWLAF